MKVYVLDPIADEGLEIIEQKFDVVRWDNPAIEDWRAEADGIVLRGNTWVTGDDLAHCKRLQVISKQGAGVDRIDLAAARARGIPVMNTPGANAEAVAELSVGLLLALSRRIAVCDRRLRAGENASREAFIGQGLDQKCLGIIGMGQIGRSVAYKLGRGFNMKVIGFDPHIPTALWPDGSEQVADLEALLARADVVSVHCNLTEETRGMIGAGAISRMKPNAMVVCSSRGGIVDEAALFEALVSGRIYGAALDVFETEPPAADHPLFSIPTFVGTNHIGASSMEVRTQAAKVVAQQLVDVLDGKAPRNVVN